MGTENIKEVSITIKQPAIELKFQKIGHSINCVIDPSGHMIGKKLDHKSRKKDIGLEIFAPCTTAAFVRRPQDASAEYNNLYAQILTYQLEHMSDAFTPAQIMTIANIFAQKEKLAQILKNLMLPRGCQIPMFYQLRHPLPTPVLYPSMTELSIKIIDSNKPGSRDILSDQTSYLKKVSITYNEDKFLFVLTPTNNLSSANLIQYDHEGAGYTPEIPKTGSFIHMELNGLEENNAEGHSIIFHTWYARNGSFETDHRAHEKEHILYGEYDIFDYFVIDEALLLLEEVQHPSGTPILYWTLALAQNMGFKYDIQRIASNNRHLLDPGEPAIYRVRAK